jgi:hypothetical protein
METAAVVAVVAFAAADPSQTLSLSPAAAPAAAVQVAVGRAYRVIAYMEAPTAAVALLSHCQFYKHCHIEIKLLFLYVCRLLWAGRTGL